MLPALWLCQNQAQVIVQDWGEDNEWQPAPSHSSPSRTHNTARSLKFGSPMQTPVRAAYTQALYLDSAVPTSAYHTFCSTTGFMHTTLPEPLRRCACKTSPESRLLLYGVVLQYGSPGNGFGGPAPGRHRLSAIGSGMGSGRSRGRGFPMEEFWNSLFARFPSQSQPLLRAVSAVFWHVRITPSMQQFASLQGQPSMQTAQRRKPTIGQPGSMPTAMLLKASPLHMHSS